MRRYSLNGNEPVRWGFLLFGGLASTSTFLLAWGAGQDWRLALGAALGELGLSLAAGEAVSMQTHGPRSHEDEVVDAASHARSSPL